jgi:hypothetical protein
MKYNKSLSSVALLAALGLSLSACGGSTQTAPTSPNVEAITPAPATTSSAPAAEKSARGNLIKKVGQPAGMFNPDNNKQTVNFTINSIKAGVPCTGPYPQPSENGHFVILSVTAATTEELGKESYPKFDINPSMFQFIGANGTTFNGNLGSAASYGCLPDEENFPMAGMGPAEKVKAKVVLDVPAKTGTLVFKPMGALSGWEYKF